MRSEPFKVRTSPGIDLVTAAAIRLADGTAGHTGHIRAFRRQAYLCSITSANWAASVRPTKPWRKNFATRRGATLPCLVSDQTIDGNFVAALTKESPLCCPADQALDTVRLLEAIGSSAATGQIVRLI